MNNDNSIIEGIEASFLNSKALSDSIALKFQERSKYDKYSLLEEHNKILSFTHPSLLVRSSQPYKCYPTKRRISLSDYINTGSIQTDIFDIISKRRSKRDFIPYSISLYEISMILHYGYGITRNSQINGLTGTWSYRSVPSGGALYPLELYLYINTSALPKGIYHYRPDIESIEVLCENDYIETLSNILSISNINIDNISCIIFITSVFQRQMVKYGERGYRFILQEVGAVGQNISLVSESLKLSSCIIGGYIDDAINELLNINYPLETIQGIITIGKSK